MSETSVTRINEFTALEGRGDELRDLIAAFLPSIEASPGCRSCRLLQGIDDPARIVVIEEWESVEAHRTAMGEIPREGLQAAMALLAEPPTGRYLSG